MALRYSPRVQQMNNAIHFFFSLPCDAFQITFFMTLDPLINKQLVLLIIFGFNDLPYVWEAARMKKSALRTIKSEFKFIDDIIRVSSLEFTFQPHVIT
jgi:hypothetical protein